MKRNRFTFRFTELSRGEVEREADKQGYASTSEFIRDSIRRQIHGGDDQR